MIYFASTYDPIQCGIGTYTRHLTQNLPIDTWRVLSFDLKQYNTQLFPDCKVPDGHAWYGIPGGKRVSAHHIRDGIKALGKNDSSPVLWIQHENAIWPDDYQLAETLKQLTIPKIITFHSLHSQSDETASGLRRDQYKLLSKLLPHVDAITVFSKTVQRAVIHAFPHYIRKIHLLGHGVSFNPKISSMSRIEAKEMLNDFLLVNSDLDKLTKDALFRERVLLDPNIFVIGSTGFLCPGKQSQLLFWAQGALQGRVETKRIAALRIGAARNSEQSSYARRLRVRTDGKTKFLLETCLPDEMVLVAERAFDMNFYWPAECTQSGILASALGVGSLIAGKKMEGSGEMLHEAGAIAETSLGLAIQEITNVIANPNLGTEMEKNALAYASQYSWQTQAEKHRRLATEVTARYEVETSWQDILELVRLATYPQTTHAGVGIL